jgi:hypothetical protein
LSAAKSTYSAAAKGPVRSLSHRIKAHWIPTLEASSNAAEKRNG